MTSALERAYASNEATPLLTYEFSHASLTGGVLRYVSGFYDLSATLEDSSNVTFTAAAIQGPRPAKTTDGRQVLTIQIDNTSNAVFTQIKQVIDANRTSETPVICKFREYLEADTSAPASAVFTFTVMGVSINRNTAVITAAYAPIPDMTWPRRRYFTNSYPGLKYV